MGHALLLACLDEISNLGFGSLGSRLYDIGMKWFGTAIIFALFALAAASGCLLAQNVQKLDSATDQIVSGKAVVTGGEVSISVAPACSERRCSQPAKI
jgi:hypothetical protein